MIIFRLALLLITSLLPIAATAQIAQSTDTRIKEIALSISRSASKLRWTDSSDSQQYERVKSKATLEIYESIDAFIHDTPIENISKLDSDLKYLLKENRGNPEYTGAAFAQQSDLLYGRSVIVAYGITRGGTAVNDSAITIRGYRLDRDKLILSDTTGQEFDGYGLFTKMLPPPITGEAWLIAWGPLHGFNGSKNRVRIYAFDGKTFRTIWNPDDMMNATIHVTSSGFSINRLDEDRYFRLRRCPCFVQEDYVLMLQGPEQVGRRYID